MMTEFSHTISLREYIDARFDSLDKAISLSREDMNRRLEGLNQLRNEVVTDRSEFQRKESCETQHQELVHWREMVNRKLTVLETRSITWTAAVGVFFIILGFVLRWIGK